MRERNERKDHGRIEQRTITVLPAEALGPHPEWPSIAQIAKVERRREVEQNRNCLAQRPRPRNIFTLNAIVLELAAFFGLSPNIAVERCQDDKNLAIKWLGG